MEVFRSLFGLLWVCCFAVVLLMRSFLVVLMFDRLRMFLFRLVEVVVLVVGLCERCCCV